MTDEPDIEKLLSLARLSVSENEKEKLRGEIASILSYISDIRRSAVGALTPTPARLHNVLRDDGEPHESGHYTEALLRAFPNREEDYLKVKKIIPS